jgi:hypothetical protein
MLLMTISIYYCPEHSNQNNTQKEKKGKEIRSVMNRQRLIKVIIVIDMLELI